MIKKLSTLTAALVLAGCSLSPTYERPDSPVRDTYPGQVAGSQATADVLTGADLGWREVIQEPRLIALLDIALTNNRDLLIATQRVEEARAAYGIQRSDLLPSVGAMAEQTVQRTPPTMLPDVPPGAPQPDRINRTYTAGLGITAFELDLWGRKRNLSEAAFQRYLATDEARRAVQHSLISQTASVYFTWRTAQTLQNLAARTLNAHQNTYDLVKNRFDAGIASRLELAQARTNLEGVRASLAAANRGVAQAENALEVLIGQPIPADLPAAVPFGADNLIRRIPAGAPSDLLVRRPDIIAAEHRLKAANADIGAARAAFFPSISLTGLFGTISPEFSGLFDRHTETWRFVPTLNLPIFTAGRLRNSLNLAEVRQEIAVLEYEKAIQVAFQEVADGLAGEQTYEAQLDALREQQAAATQALALSEQRYKAGIDSFLQVQQAQIGLFAVQQGFVQVGLASLQNRLELYAALGGGWTPTTVTAQMLADEAAGSSAAAQATTTE